MTDVTADDEHATRLRHQVVDELVEHGAIVSSEVEAVMRKVARHSFAPEASLEDAYRTRAPVVTKRNTTGQAVSSVSAPLTQALMLEQAGIQPGMAVLEVGSGGLNAAYLAELVGRGGSVTTVDIDPEITARAGRLLAEAGYPQVRVVLADAADGVPAHAPYDVIMVTVSSWDITGSPRRPRPAHLRLPARHPRRPDPRTPRWPRDRQDPLPGRPLLAVGPDDSKEPGSRAPPVRIESMNPPVAGAIVQTTQAG